MKWLFLAVLIFSYAGFILAAVSFFKTPDAAAKRSKNIISFLGSFSMGLQILAVVQNPDSIFAWNSALAFIFILTSQIIFYSTQSALKNRKLNFAFSKEHSSDLIKTGPYRFIRHPFYLAYTLCWIGGFAYAPGVMSALPLIVMIPLYLGAIAREEKQFLSSALARQYAAYQKSTGCLFPRILK